MEERKRGNPAGNTNAHVAANLKRTRQSNGVDLRELAARVKAQGRMISPSALSKIENGDRRVDVDDLTAFAYALETTPAALLKPPEEADQPAGVPEGRFTAEEIETWVEGRVALTVPDLIRYWTDEARTCQSYIKRIRDMVRHQRDATPPSGHWVTPTEVLEDRLAGHRARLAQISGRLMELDPMSVPLEETPDGADL